MGAFDDIGQRLRAYRLGAGLSSEEVAERLHISRAAVYRIEAGEIVKLETLMRLANVLGTSLTSLLGVGTEYYSSALGYFERMRQLEDGADHVVAHFEPASYLLTTPAYTKHLRRMLREALPPNIENPARALRDIDDVIATLDERKAAFAARRFSIVSFVSLPDLERFVELGLTGKLASPPRERARYREAARLEVAHLATLMKQEEMGVQIAVIEGPMPNVTFQLFRGGEQTTLGLSPFRLGEQPNVWFGIASVTAAPEPIALYQRLVADLWRESLRGVRGARRLQQLVARSSRLD